MGDLREKVARAIYIELALDGDEQRNQGHLAAVFGDAARPDYVHYGEKARRSFDIAIAAVLEAMQEPSEAMIRVGQDAPFAPIDHQDAEHVWQAMLTVFKREALPPDS